MSNEITKQQQGNTGLAAITPDAFGSGAPQIPSGALPPTIKIMRESPQYEMPDGNLVRSFTGHILYWHEANQYWAHKFGEGESVVPDCLSTDGIRPDGGENPLPGPCRIGRKPVCPMNEFGSDSERGGKQCQNTIRMFILVDGAIVPSLLKCPPSSLAAKGNLMKFLGNAPNVSGKLWNGAYTPIKIKFSLERKEFTGGMSASIPVLETVRVLDPVEDKEEVMNLIVNCNEFKKAYVGSEKAVLETDGERHEE